MKKAVIIALLALVASPMFAQYKIGYCNIEFVLAKWPAMKQVESQLKTEQEMLQKEVQGLYQEYQMKAQQYQQGESMMTEFVKQDKVSEIKGLEQRIQMMEQNSQMRLMKKQEELLAPLLAKIESQIQVVAKENSYNYVFNQNTPQGTSIVLYADDEDNNITLKVLMKLGVTLSPEEIEAAKQ